jgi:hypothetical protein
MFFKFCMEYYHEKICFSIFVLIVGKNVHADRPSTVEESSCIPVNFWKSAGAIQVNRTLNIWTIHHLAGVNFGTAFGIEVVVFLISFFSFLLFISWLLLTVAVHVGARICPIVLWKSVDKNHTPHMHKHVQFGGFSYLSMMVWGLSILCFGSMQPTFSYCVCSMWKV